MTARTFRRSPPDPRPPRDFFTPPDSRMYSSKLAAFVASGAPPPPAASCIASCVVASTGYCGSASIARDETGRRSAVASNSDESHVGREDDGFFSREMSETCFSRIKTRAFSLSLDRDSRAAAKLAATWIRLHTLLRPHIIITHRNVYARKRAIRVTASPRRRSVAFRSDRTRRGRRRREGRLSSRRFFSSRGSPSRAVSGSATRLFVFNARTAFCFATSACKGDT